MKNLKNIGKVLSRNEMRNVSAGTREFGGGSGSTTCYGASKICHTDGAGINYRCATVVQPESEADCCCGHDAGNTNCIMG